MTRPSKRELEHALDELGSDRADGVDLSNGWHFLDEEPPEDELVPLGDGWAIHVESDGSDGGGSA